jgi:hypothetical protein
MLDRACRQWNIGHQQYTSSLFGDFFGKFLITRKLCKNLASVELVVAMNAVRKWSSGRAFMLTMLAYLTL